MAEESSSVPATSEKNIMKQGWLSKRGEYYKNWRPRYFVLFDNGSLLGFKTKPENGFNNPLNNFTVKGCEILKTERPKPNTFIIRGLHWSTVIERTFNAQTYADRNSWMDAIKTVNDKLRLEDSDGSDPIMDEADLPTNFINRKKKSLTLESFEFLKVIGAGSFGKVILCREKSSQRLYAIKILRKDSIIKSHEVAHTLTENRVLQKVDHPFLTKLKYSFTTKDRLCFVLEYVNGGDLYFHLRKDLLFPEERVRFYGAEICLALGYLHERGIIYRDLKLENLLLDSEGHIKITDFGLCKENISYGRTTKTFCGTPEYLSPEVLNENDYGSAVDWWGYGVSMYEMMVGRLPFYNEDHDMLYQQIVYCDVKFPQTLSNEARHFLRGLLMKNPNLRLGGGPNDHKDVMAHPFFNSINWKDILEKKVTPPFKPHVKSETDVSHFDEEFTGESVRLSPTDNGPLNVIDEENEHDEFIEFSFQTLSSTNSSSIAYSFNSDFSKDV